MFTTWDNERGLLYVFLPFKLVPQALQKIYQSHEVQMILVAPKQETASSFPELLELSQQDLIPLYAEGQPLLTQDVILPDKETETGHQIYMRGDFAGHPKGKGTFTGSCRYDVKIPTSVMKHIGEDSSIFVGQNDGKSSMSEVIISVNISYIASISHHLTSHVSGFCAASLEVRFCSGSAQQAAHQDIQAGTTCTTPNYA